MVYLGLRVFHKRAVQGLHNLYIGVLSFRFNGHVLGLGLYLGAGGITRYQEEWSKVLFNRI